MAKFLTTTGVSHLLEELIKGTQDRLILISPYLQFHNKIKNNIENLNVQKRDIRIVYRENKLQVDENNWLESQIGVRTSICPTLHSKCYLNESEAIVTSMNLYSFSQQNNDEMGIHVTKEKDPELYKDIYNEAQRLLTISKEIRVSVKTIEKEIEKPMLTREKLSPKQKDYSNSTYKSTSALAKIIEVSGKDLFEFFEEHGLIEKEGKSWCLTEEGEEYGATMKKGQYGEYVAWPEDILEELEDELDLFFDEE
jgi:hypothetical protein